MVLTSHLEGFCSQSLHTYKCMVYYPPPLRNNTHYLRSTKFDYTLATYIHGYYRVLSYNKKKTKKKISLRLLGLTDVARFIVVVERIAVNTGTCVAAIRILAILVAASCSLLAFVNIYNIVEIHTRLIQDAQCYILECVKHIIIIIQFLYNANSRMADRCAAQEIY